MGLGDFCPEARPASVRGHAPYRFCLFAASPQMGAQLRPSDQVGRYLQPVFQISLQSDCRPGLMMSPVCWKLYCLGYDFLKYSKRFCLFVLKAFGFLLLGLFFVLFWQESLKELKRRRLQKIYDHLYGRKQSKGIRLPYNKEMARKRKLWDEFFELQKQRFHQRQEELREEFSKQIEQMRTQTNRKEPK
jgi:hypothetical protein